MPAAPTLYIQDDMVAHHTSLAAWPYGAGTWGPQLNYHCCTQLSNALGSKVNYPNTTTYNSTLASYWSLQEGTTAPSCIIVPTTSHDVSMAVSLMSTQDCPFAIKGQGHAPAQGFANIQSGVTLDLTSLTDVYLSHDLSSTSVGIGSNWSAVYEVLDPYNVTVAGARNGAVGVGGFLLGGGISFYAPREGWGCDNVLNFEVVLASGEIVNANGTSNPDLWRALKGGGNNFGVVTRVDLKTFPQGDLLGGFLNLDFSSKTEVLEDFAALASDPDYDVYASIVAGFTYVSAADAWSIGLIPTYTKPVADPAVYRSFRSIQPQVSSTLRITNMTALANEENHNLPQLNALFYTTTYGVSAPLMSTMLAIINSTARTISPAPPGGVIWSVAFEPFPAVVSAYAAEKGGNSLGTSPSDGAQFITLISAFWPSTASTPLVEAAAADIVRQSDAAARQMGLARSTFRYANYANYRQRPLDGYGRANRAFLGVVAKRYDPRGVFQRLVPGGFKLDGRV